MTTKAKALDRLIDAIAGEDVPMTSQTVAGRLEQLAQMIEDGDISGGGEGNITLLEIAYVPGTTSYVMSKPSSFKELVEITSHDGKNIAVPVIKLQEQGGPWSWQLPCYIQCSQHGQYDYYVKIYIADYAAYMHDKLRHNDLEIVVDGNINTDTVTSIELNYTSQQLAANNN